MNNSGKEGKVVKKCPFSGQWCTEAVAEACMMFIPITQQRVSTLGVKEVVQGGMCCLPALAMIMSNRVGQGQAIPFRMPNNPFKS